MAEREEADAILLSVSEESTDSAKALQLVSEQFLLDISETVAEGHAARTKRDATPALRSARLVALDERRATITWRGRTERLEADVAVDVELALLALALRNGDGVLVEVVEGERPVVVGVMQTRVPREVHMTSDKVVIEAAQEVVLRAGRAALRLREDGDVELVGSRISATSRGLFRLVGRILRLN